MVRRRVMAAVILWVTSAILIAPGVASATTLTSPTGTVSTPTIKAESEGHVILDLDGLPRIECASNAEGTVSSHGKGKPANGSLSSLSFVSCTSGWHVTVTAAGSLGVNWSSAYNGDVFSSGATVEATNASLGNITCRYTTSNTTVGTLTGGSPATMHISASMPFHSGSIFCGTNAPSWTGSYKVTSPSSLFVDNEPPPGTSITSPTGTVATPTIKAESEGHVVLHNPAGKIECAASAEGAIEAHGNFGPARGNLSALSFTGCTNGWHVTVVSAGEIATNWTSGYNGDVFSSGATIEATNPGLGAITCRYTTKNTTVGTVTGGSPATMHINASIPFHSGSIFCGTGATAWTGSYKVTSPSSLFVDEETEPDSGISITSPTGTVSTPTIKAESEGHVSLDHPIAKVQCQWAFQGTVESHAAEAAVIPLSSLSTTGCTEEWHATTVTAGKLEITGTSGYNGKVTWSGGTTEMTRLGTTCRYKSENTQIGTLTGGSPATVDIEGKLPFHSGSPLCGTEAYSLTGSFKLTSPSALYVDKAS